jgi:formate hydrogenlyase subunit 6/NADH:ubiquinone oxidoreductase subunit I
MTRAHRFGMVIDPQRCIHCAACVVACKAENAVPDGHSRSHLEERSTTRSQWVVMAPSRCIQCDDAPCVRVCPTGATTGTQVALGRSRQPAASVAGAASKRVRATRYFDGRPAPLTSAFCATASPEAQAASRSPARTRVFDDLDAPSSTAIDSSRPAA